jgi:hypothetical protein
LSNFTPISLHILKCSWVHTLSHHLMYCSFASIGHADIMWSTVLSDCWHSLHVLSVDGWNIILHDILFVMPNLVLSLFHFHFLLSLLLLLILLLLYYYYYYYLLFFH